MKVLKNILAVLLVLMISVITFYTWNLIFSFVSNYQALSPTSLSCIPMVMFMSEIYIILFAVYNYVVLKRRDAYFWRKYSLLVAGFALVGFAFSIVCGTYVYHTFIGDYVFAAYPLVMLIAHGALLAFCCYVAFISIKEIVLDKPEKSWKNGKLYWLKELGIAELLMFGLEKFGGIVLLPLLWSSYDSALVIPFYIQLLMPLALFVLYMIDQTWKHNRKLNVILYGSILAYSLFSLLYMGLVSVGRYPEIVNPLSPIMQLERLLTTPYGFIILYALCLIMSTAFVTYNVIKLVLSKKEAK